MAKSLVPQLALVAGASGSIGNHVIHQLQERGIRVRALVRNPDKLTSSPEEIFVGNIQNSNAIEGVCSGVNYVISCAGAPLHYVNKFQTKGVTFHSIDEVGNLNLLKEAVKAKVKRFGYLSTFGGRFLGRLEYIRAHESFAASLTDANLNSFVVRSTITFSTLRSLIEQGTKSKKISIVGTGLAKTNPIAEVDVAKCLVNALHGKDNEIDIGGPDIYSYGELAQIASEKLGDIPIKFSLTWREQIKAGIRRFRGSHNFDVDLYRLALSATDIIAPTWGTQRLSDYYESTTGLS